MKKNTIMGVVLAVAVLAAPTVADAAAVERVLTFSGTLRTSTGAVETLYKDVYFRLYDVATGGTALFSELHGVQPGTDGSFSVRIGSLSPLDPALFDRQLYLGIQVSGEAEMRPRTQLTPTPYTWSMDWSSLRGFPAACPSGQFVTGLGPALTCATVPQAIASVAGLGMIDATTSSGAVTVSLKSNGCTSGQVLGFDGMTWGCQTPPAPVTNVVASAPLTGGGGGTPTVGLMSCSDGQTLKVSGSAWGCGADVDTDTGLTAVSHDNSLVGDGSPANPLGLVFRPVDTTGGDGFEELAARRDHSHTQYLPLDLGEAFQEMGSPSFGTVVFGGFPARYLNVPSGPGASWFLQIHQKPNLVPTFLTISVTTVITQGPPTSIPLLGFSAYLLDAGGTAVCALGTPSRTTVPTTPPLTYTPGQSAVIKAGFDLTSSGCTVRDDATLVVQIRNDDPALTYGAVLVNGMVQVTF